MKWLARLKQSEKTPAAYPTEPTKEAFVGSVGSPLAPLQNSTAENDALSAQVVLFVRRGLSPEDADQLAIRLAQRDRQEDDRRLCIECSHLGKSAGIWQCHKWQQRQHYSADIPDDLVTLTLHRCKLFFCRSLKTSQLTLERIYRQAKVSDPAIKWPGIVD